MQKIGLIGFGFIGKTLFETIMAGYPGLSFAWVHDADPARMSTIPSDMQLATLSASLPSVDLVVEAAHPDVVRHHGAAILRQHDFLPLSLTALADDVLRQQFYDSAAAAGTRLWLPHGASIGVDGVFALRDRLESVTITTIKPVANLDHSVRDAAAIGANEARIVYEGPTRDACALYPRSVNSHAAIALAGIGFDRTRSILIEDPVATHTRTDVVCHGDDIDMTLTRSNPMQGVSSTMMPQMVLASVLTVLRQGQPLFC